MSDQSLHAVVRLRTLGPSGLNPPQEQVLDRLFTLSDTQNHPLGELDIDVWGASMGITQTDGHDPGEIDELVTEFRQWAADRDCTLRPAFDWRSSDAEEEDEDTTDKPEQHSQIVTPLITLALYNGSSLQAVYPHLHGGEVRTIHDGVAALESVTEGDSSKSRDRHVEIEM